MPRKAQRQFQIGMNIEALLRPNHVDVAKSEYATASLTLGNDDDSSSSEDYSWDESDDSSSYYDSSDSDVDIDEAAFFDELQSWMAKLTQSQRPVKRSSSMPLIGAVNVMPKYKEQISHHPIVAHRIRNCELEFMQNPVEVVESRKAKANPEMEKPEDCVLRILATVGTKDLSGLAPFDSSFLGVTDERVMAHSKEMTDAARSVDMRLFKQFLKEGRNLQACNKFGESLVHIVCRRGSLEGLSFLIEKARVSLMVRDDFGRNPLHDAAWTDKPSFELIKFILTEAPCLLFAKDARGSTPMAYIPRPRWEEWSNFLALNKELILAVAM
jgi:hypothetical protein